MRTFFELQTRHIRFNGGFGGIGGIEWRVENPATNSSYPRGAVGTSTDAGANWSMFADGHGGFMFEEWGSGISGHVCNFGSEQGLLATPLKVIVTDTTVTPNLTGEYVDDAWTADMGIYTLEVVHEEGGVTVGSIPSGVVASNADCDAVAEAIVRRAKSQQESGMIRMPIYNCLQELYDKVQVFDDRGNTSGIGRVGGIYFHWPPKKIGNEHYTMEVRLGGLQRSIATDMSGLVDQMNIELMNRGGLNWNLIDPGTIPQIDWTAILPTAIQGYQHSITFSSSDYHTLNWTGGTGALKFYDGTPKDIANGTKDLASGTIWYIYFDLADASPTVLKATTDYKSVMTEYTGLVCLAQKGATTSSTCNFLPSYGKEPLITPDWINMTALKSYDYGDGTKLQSILDTQIQAGAIKLSADTYFATGYDPTGKEVQVYRNASAPSDTTKLWLDTTLGLIKAYVGGAWVVQTGEWYLKSGVLIDATKGIRLFGTDMAFATFADETNARAGTNYQCKMGADGKIYAGAGAVMLDADGITITHPGSGTADHITFYHSNTLMGYVSPMSDGVSIATTLAKHIYLAPGLPGGLLFMVLPTSDPHVANALWNSSGTLKISAGP